MINSIKIEIKPQEIIEAVRKMKKKERDAFLEELIAVASPGYLESIRDARDDYKAGRTQTHGEIFGR
jgi:hypothetical protein